MKIMDKADKIFTTIGMIALFAIMLIISVDGLGRAFLNTPIVGAYTLIESYLMVAMVFPVIGYTWAMNGHISVSLVIRHLPLAVRNILYLCTMIMALAFFGIILYTGFNTTIEAITMNKMTSGLVSWPLWLSYVWMPLGALVFFIRVFLETVLGIVNIAKKGISHVTLNKAVSGSHDIGAE